MALTKPMEHCIFQNNAINIYETFFEDLEPAPLLDPCSSKTLNVYRDPCERKRPVTHLSYSPCGSKLAVSYCNRLFQGDAINLSNNSYIWELGNVSYFTIRLTHFDVKSFFLRVQKIRIHHCSLYNHPVQAFA